MRADQLEKVREKISEAARSVGRKTSEVQLIAVSKTVPAESVRGLYRLGVRSFAENYAQEAIEKQSQLADLKDIEWHFIGHLQTNKVKNVLGKFRLIHSVDRKNLVDELIRRASGPQEILIEVNLVGERSKSGCAPELLQDLVEHVCRQNQVRLRGLMFMPPLGLPASEQEAYFARAQALRNEARKWVTPPHDLKELSMGTSHDFVNAIRGGSTMVRLGTILFGERKA